jgi:thioredoxin-related protein
MKTLKSNLIILVLAIALSVLSASCERKGGKTPADFKNSVAWIDGRAALPVFPFGTSPIYVYINSPESAPCKKMAEEIFARPEIIKFINEHFTSISVNPESFDSIQFWGETYTRDEFKSALKISKYPMHMFFNMRGELKGVYDGAVALKEFKQLLKYIAEGYVEKYDFPTFQEMPEAELDTIWKKF